MMRGDGMGWGMGWMWLFWLLLIVGTVVLVLVLVKAFTGNAGGGPRQGGTAPPPTRAGPRRSREILEERYARGEISTEEFRERLRTLEEGER
ncbi:UNVERIFIED_CONTAM: SHOCT domain-containing protein [Kocuria sp. CPCC 205316]|uniref:SHOCT domain-containing protein n=1 Tax=Kocuria TaxID=57493 RepID=UPI0036DDE566